MKTELAVVDLDGSILSKVDLKTDENHPSEFVTRCMRELEKLRTRTIQGQFTGVGVTVAGVVDSMLSRVVYAPNLGWENLDLGGIIRGICPNVDMVTVENDAKASALAELLLGKHGLSSNSIIFLSIDHGIGSGIVVENHILSGSSHAAGEFGHMTIVEGGDVCSCGNRGCWELYASDRATVRRYATMSGVSQESSRTPSINDVILAAQNGNQEAIDAVKKTAQYLGLGIANIIRSIDPELIIIGGSITQAWELIYGEIMDAVKKRGYLGNQRTTKILPTSLQDSPALLGAAALSIRKIFADQRIVL